MIPVLEGGLFHPPVGGAAVVGDHIHDYLQAPLVGLLHKGTIEGVVPEAGVYVVIVCTGIAVVGLVGLVVQQKRGAPDGRSAQVLYVIQVVYDALQIASVACNGILPVHLVRQPGNRPGHQRTILVSAFRPLGTGKAVRHDEVDHIGR